MTSLFLFVSIFMFFTKALFGDAVMVKTIAEFVRELKAVLESRPKHVLADVAKRKFKDRASYYGSEITNFLESDLGREALSFLKNRKANVYFTLRTGWCIRGLGGNGLWIDQGNSLGPSEESITAYEIAASAIKGSNIFDPFEYMIKELCKLAKKKK